MHVAYGRGGPNLSRLQAGAVQLHVLEPKGNHSLGLAWTILRLIRRVRPDVVQTWLLQMDVLGGSAALACRVPLILSERSSAAGYPATWKNRLRRLVGSQAACIVANSHGGLDYWRADVPAERLRLVRNCVVSPDRQVHEPIEEGVAHRMEQPLIVFAGRFSYEKNIPTLVEAFITVAKLRPDVKMVMFGDGPERPAAARRIAEAGVLDRIVIADFTSHLPAWMMRAATCVSVSHFEGHPNVVMEAAAIGCPLILSDIPSHRELFDETSALLVPPDSPAGISQAILVTLDDEPHARERAERARTVAAQFELGAVASAYRGIYEEIVSGSR